VDLNTVDKIKEGLRLDYSTSPFDGATEVGILEFPKKVNFDTTIRYGSEMGGPFTEGYPLTRNGFTGTIKGKVIPEYHLGKNVAIDIPDVTKLYKLGPNGKELIATFPLPLPIPE